MKCFTKSDLTTKSLGLDRRDAIINEGIASECYKYRPMHVEEICENEDLYELIERWAYCKEESIFNIIGPSGCGKTTALKLILEKLNLSYLYLSYNEFIKTFMVPRKSVLQQLNNVNTNQVVILVADPKMDIKQITEYSKRIKLILVSQIHLNLQNDIVYQFDSPSRENMASILAWMCIESGIDLDDEKICVIEKLSRSHDVRRAISSLFMGQTECPPIAWCDTYDEDLIRCYRTYEVLDGPLHKVPVLLDTLSFMDQQMTQYPGYYFGAEIAATACHHFVSSTRHTINARCAQIIGRISSVKSAFFDLGFAEYAEYQTISKILSSKLQLGEINSIPESMQSSWLTIMRFTNKVMNAKTRNLKNIIQSITVKRI